MSPIRACVYDGSDTPRLIVEGTAKQINAQIVSASDDTWREVPSHVAEPGDAPARSSLGKPAELLADRR